MKEKDGKNKSDLHTSVLLNELVKNIKLFTNKKNIIVDCTLGMGGHAREIIKKLNPGDIFIGFDADIRNLKIASENLKKEFESNGINLIFINDNFSNIKENLEKLNIFKITGIYYDLGISSLHVDDAERGFSFKLDGPLDMRFDILVGIPASVIVNSYSKDNLIKIFQEYGEEPMSRKIADAIFEKRKTGFRFKTTIDLSKLIGEISKFPKSKNRIFQALRIEANKELETIEKSVNDSIKLLDKNGSIFIISFHSLEDRIIKNIFKNESKDCICHDLICSCNHKKQLKILTKKPIIPTTEEVKNNPRARSAKARLAIKIN